MAVRKAPCVYRWLRLPCLLMAPLRLLFLLHPPPPALGAAPRLRRVACGAWGAASRFESCGSFVCLWGFRGRLTIRFPVVLWATVRLGGVL